MGMKAMKSLISLTFKKLVQSIFLYIIIYQSQVMAAYVYISHFFFISKLPIQIVVTIGPSS